MTREELQATFQELLGYATPEHQARTSEILTAVTNGFTEALDAQQTAASQAEELTAANEKLRAANMSLFLQVGSVPKEKPLENQTPAETPPQTLSYDSLFDEKGELK